MKKTTVKFNYFKETKGTYRYAEDAPDGQQVIGSMYIRKSHLGSNPPQKIQVTIEEVGLDDHVDIEKS